MTLYKITFSGDVNCLIGTTCSGSIYQSASCDVSILRGADGIGQPAFLFSVSHSHCTVKHMITQF